MDIEIAQKSVNEHPNLNKMDEEPTLPIDELKKIINGIELNSKANSEASLEDMLEENFCRTNQEQFDNYYGEEYTQALKKNVPDLEDFLKSTAVSENLRARMIDWMLEVFNFFRPASDDYTYFKAIILMDLFFKYNQRQRTGRRLQDSDVHLIGLTCIFIATKYEDNRHILIDSLIKNACKGKFEPRNVIETEIEILAAIGFNSSIPTHLEFIDSILNNSFEDQSTEFFHKIRYSAIFLMKRCIYFKSLAASKMDSLALACVILSISANFNVEAVQQIARKESIDDLAHEKNTLVAVTDPDRFADSHELLDRRRQTIPQRTDRPHAGSTELLRKLLPQPGQPREVLQNRAILRRRRGREAEVQRRQTLMSCSPRKDWSATFSPVGLLS